MSCCSSSEYGGVAVPIDFQNKHNLPNNTITSVLPPGNVANPKRPLLAKFTNPNIQIIVSVPHASFPPLEVYFIFVYPEKLEILVSVLVIPEVALPFGSLTAFKQNSI